MTKKAGPGRGHIGPMIANDARRKLVNARLPPMIIDAIKRAADENGTSVTDEIEARLVETLIADSLLNRDVAVEVCGAFAAVSVATS